MSNERDSCLATKFFARVCVREGTMSFENSPLPDDGPCWVGCEQETFKAFHELVTSSQANPVSLQQEMYGFQRRISSFVGVTPGLRRALKAILDMIAKLLEHNACLPWQREIMTTGGAAPVVLKIGRAHV